MAERIKKHIKVFDNWNVEEELASGTCNAVFRLEKSAYGITDTSVLKVIDLYDWYGKRSELPDEENERIKARIEKEVRKVEKEVTLMQQLRGSTNIVDYLDFEVYNWEDEEDESFGTSLLIRMEQLENLALEQRNGRRFTDLEIVRLGKDICSALMLCHSQMIVHRDIKPDNIYRNKNGSYKLGDFGISRILDIAQQNSMGRSEGTRAYAAPEQCKGEACDFSADIYSLGLVMYEMANGNRLPFAEGIRATGEDVRRRIDGEEFPPIEGANESLAEAIIKACSYHPTERYQSAEEFYSELCFVEGVVEMEVAMKEADVERYAAFCRLFDVRSQSEILKDQQEFAALLQAAEQGYAKAQYQVGQCYLKGEKSVPCDNEQAMKWLGMSAQQENKDAQFVLGGIYMNGLGVGKDPEEGLRWLGKSAKQGNARAMFHIGSYNERMAEESGTDVIQANAYIAEAAAWYKLAAEKGDKLGQIALQRLQT